MNKLKEIVKIGLMLAFVFIGNLAVILFATLILEGITKLDTDTLLETSLFKNTSYIVSILYTLFCIFLFREKEEEKTFPMKDILFLILFGILFSVSINIFIYKMTNTTSSICNIYLVIETGIMGPILEEYMYRGKILKCFHKIFSFKWSCILTTLLFALVHTGIINIFYAFLLGSILMILKQKYKSIKIPILFHIVVNTTAVLLPLLLF